MTSPASYSTQNIYSSVPQYIQDQDALEGYPLWGFIYGMVKPLDDIGVLSFDDIGSGVVVTPVDLEASKVTQANLLSAMLPTDTTFTIFGTDSTWGQIPSGSDFEVVIEGEHILIPGGSYEWTMPTVTFTGVTRGYDGGTPAAHAPSAGATGTIDLNYYAGAPGWSQILDVQRCPQYALPWLGQFIGIELALDNLLTYQQTLERLQNRSGFQRATIPSIVAELITVINVQGAGGTPILAGEVIVLENTEILGWLPASLGAAITDTIGTTIVINHTNSSWEKMGSNAPFVITVEGEKMLVPQGTYNWMNAPVTISGVTRGYEGSAASTHSIDVPISVVGGKDIYGFNEYSLTALVPVRYLSLYTYAQLIAAAGGDGTYNAAQTFVGTLGGHYNDLAATSLPSSGSPYINFVYRYRPAGIQIFIGAY